MKELQDETVFVFIILLISLFVAVVMQGYHEDTTISFCYDCIRWPPEDIQL